MMFKVASTISIQTLPRKFAIIQSDFVCVTDLLKMKILFPVDIISSRKLSQGTNPYLPGSF